MFVFLELLAGATVLGSVLLQGHEIMGRGSRSNHSTGGSKNAMADFSKGLELEIEEKKHNIEKNKHNYFSGNKERDSGNKEREVIYNGHHENFSL